MKIGIVSSILENYNFEKMIDILADMEFECVEVACWPVGKAERRYAGVSHIDVERVLDDDKYADHILEYSGKKGVKISSLAFYPNPMDEDLDKREKVISHLKNVIKASAKLGVNMVTTFIGRSQTKTVEENLELVQEVWPPIIELAEKLEVRIAIENCPMLFGADQWPGGQNLMTTPIIWKKVLDILDSEYLGINYDPSHFIWQQIDYIKPIYQFKDKIFHVHFKDIKMYQDKLAQEGVMAYPLNYMSPKLPGYGDVNWAKFVSALSDIRYNGYACIEVEDKAFESTTEDVLNSLKVSKKYLKQYTY